MKEFIVLVEKDTFDKNMRVLQVSHNGGAGWSTIAFYSDQEALQIANALQQSVQADVAYCSCKNPIPAHENSMIICAGCMKPQRR